MTYIVYPQKFIPQLLIHTLHKYDSVIARSWDFIRHFTSPLKAMHITYLNGQRQRPKVFGDPTLRSAYFRPRRRAIQTIISDFGPQESRYFQLAVRVIRGELWARAVVAMDPRHCKLAQYDSHRCLVPRNVRRPDTTSQAWDKSLRYEFVRMQGFEVGTHNSPANGAIDHMAYLAWWETRASRMWCNLHLLS